ncbi:futalosine hydrolase [Streptomyces sp. A5-4]|uniref:futalosine hydrolase n=1 Tax=Streptomyces sp. A5-4 TaxID=3384771 RepID=UPI003DA97B02
MRVLVVTAVPAERDAVTRAWRPDAAPDATPIDATAPDAPTPVVAGDVLLDVIAAGVGPAAAAAGAATALTRHAYALVISAGIGGGFPAVAPLGSVVVADAIVAADLGAETPEGYVPVTGLGFGTVEHLPPAALVRAVADVTGAITGTVLTVSTVTGSAARTAELRARHPRAAVEAMEGFGVAEAAALHGVPVLEIRAVSNAVGPRDRAAWRIGPALAALGAAFGKLVPVLERWEDHD